MGHARLVFAAAIAAVLGLVGAGCSSGGGDSDAGSATTASSVVVGSVATTATAAPPVTTSTTTAVGAKAQPLPAAPGAEEASEPAVPSGTASTTSTTTTSASSAPETSETPSSSTTTTTPTAPETTTTTTTTAIEVADDAVQSPSVLRIQVLNASGIAGAAGTLTAKLADAGYTVLPPGNADRRYANSAVYYAEGWQDEAQEILEESAIEEIAQTAAMPPEFAEPQTAVLILLGTDTAPAQTAEQADLRPEPRSDVALPLPDSTPRDRFVPGLADIQIYTRQNDENPETFNYIHSLQKWLRYVADFRENDRIDSFPEDRGTYENLLAVYDSIEEALDWLGFTPQNVCGAPAGYTFTDLLQPTREFSEETQNHRGAAIFATDRLIELHGGQRINPQDNLDFYIRQAVQTAHDKLRTQELTDETEAPQLILCYAWLSPSGNIPDYANALWYALLTPGVQPRESLLSQGTYHVKEISRNGNFAYLIVCHPTIGERYVRLWWREGGYRAEVTGEPQNNGCQATYEIETYREDTYGVEDIFGFAFGDRSFSASDLQAFPRPLS